MIASEELFGVYVWHLILLVFSIFKLVFCSFFVRRVISLVSNILKENLEKNDQTKNVLSSLGGLDFESREFSAPWIKIDSTKVWNSFMILSKFISIFDTILELNHDGWSLGEIKWLNPENYRNSPPWYPFRTCLASHPTSYSFYERSRVHKKSPNPFIFKNGFSEHHLLRLSLSPCHFLYNFNFKGEFHFMPEMVSIH